MNRKTIAILFLLVMLVNLIPFRAEAVEITGNCGSNLTWTLDDDGTLTISGTGNMKNFTTKQPAPWTEYQDSIKKVVIENGVTSIADYAFAAYKNLVEVSIPNSVKRIGQNAFIRCTALTSIVIPEGVTSIGPNTFYDCTGLISVKLPDSVTSIGSSAFCGCSALTEINIPKNLSKIEYYLFRYCTSLTRIVLPEGMKTIGEGAFEVCRNLYEMVIPKSMTSIGDGAFDHMGIDHVYYGGTEEMWQSLKNRPSVSEMHYSCTDPDGHWVTKMREATCGMDGRIYEVCPCGTKRDIEIFPATGNHVFDRELVQIGYLEQYHTDWLGRKAAYYKSCVCGAKGTEIFETDHNYTNQVDGICDVYNCGVKREDTETRIVVHMFRMYNPNTGEHFYTGSEEERDNLIGHGWQYEGVGFTFPANTGAPVYRLFQPSTGEHLYTMDKAEKEKLEAEGWNYEGIAFNSAYDTEAVQHRLHNPNETVGAYHFTFSEEEKQNLINAGWEYQGIGWYSCWK